MNTTKREPKAKQAPKARIVYSLTLAAKMCELIGGGLALKEVCELPGMPGRTTAYKWLALHDDFANMYARAREERADLVADEVIGIADTDPDPARARVRIDARKWWAAKVNPKKYGDKTQAEITGKDGKDLIPDKPVTPFELARYMAFILEQASERKPNGHANGHAGHAT
jgi:hypothetical protein